MTTAHCPSCKTEHHIPLHPALVGKTFELTCKNPVCKRSFRISFPADTRQATFVKKKRGTSSPAAILTIEADLTFKTTAQTYSLRPGANMVGRFDNGKEVAPADFAIKTGDLAMSRRHCCIETLLHTDGRREYLLSDCTKENKVVLNEDELGKTDQVFLEHGDQILLGNTIIRFSIVSSTPPTEKKQKIAIVSI